MELLKNIKYGRCFNYKMIHELCIFCCCECENKGVCPHQCNPSTHLVNTKDCGNYCDVVEINNESLKKVQAINETLRAVEQMKCRNIKIKR